MSYSFKNFCDDSHDALIENSGPEGREKVRRNLERFLADRGQTEQFCNADWPQGTTYLHHDPEAGFYVWGHHHPKDGAHGPHDHGSTWAVYSTLLGRADMAEWRRLDDGTKPGHAEIIPDREYCMKPGMATLYNEGGIHSAHYRAGTRLIRVTGKDLNQETVKRFNPDKQMVVDHNRSNATVGAE